MPYRRKKSCISTVVRSRTSDNSAAEACSRQRSGGRQAAVSRQPAEHHTFQAFLISGACTLDDLSCGIQVRQVARVRAEQMVSHGAAMCETGAEASQDDTSRGLQSCVTFTVPPFQGALTQDARDAGDFLSLRNKCTRKPWGS